MADFKLNVEFLADAEQLLETLKKIQQGFNNLKTPTGGLTVPIELRGPVQRAVKGKSTPEDIQAIFGAVSRVRQKTLGEQQLINELEQRLAAGGRKFQGRAQLVRELEAAKKIPAGFPFGVGLEGVSQDIAKGTLLKRLLKKGVDFDMASVLGNAFPLAGTIAGVTGRRKELSGKEAQKINYVLRSIMTGFSPEEIAGKDVEKARAVKEREYAKRKREQERQAKAETQQQAAYNRRMNQMLRTTFTYETKQDRERAAQEAKRIAGLNEREKQRRTMAVDLNQQQARAERQRIAGIEERETQHRRMQVSLSQQQIASEKQRLSFLHSINIMLAREPQLQKTVQDYLKKNNVENRDINKLTEQQTLELRKQMQLESGKSFATRRHAQQISALNFNLMRLGAQMKYLGIVSAGMLAGMIREAVTFNLQVIRMRQGLNLSYADIGKLGFVAEAAGIPFDTLTRNIGNYYQALLRAGQGTSFVAKRVREALNRIGLSPVMLGQETNKSPLDMITDVRKAFQLLTTAEEKSYAGQMVFGGAYEEMLPLLSMTDAEFNKIQETLNKMFPDFATHASGMAASIIELNSLITGWKWSIRILGGEMLRSMAPVFSMLSNWLKNAANSFNSLTDKQKQFWSAAVIGGAAFLVIGGQLLEWGANYFKIFETMKNTYPRIAGAMIAPFTTVQKVFGFLSGKGLLLPLMVILSALTAINYTVQRVAGNSRKWSQEIDDINSKLNAAKQTNEDAVDELSNMQSAAARKRADLFKREGKLNKEAGERAAKAAKELAGLNPWQRVWRTFTNPDWSLERQGIIESYKRDTEALNEATAKALADARRMEDAERRKKQVTEEVSMAYENAANFLRGYDKTGVEYTDNVNELNKAFDEETKKLQELITKYQGQTSEVMRLKQAQDILRAGQKKQLEKLESDTMEEVDKAERGYRQQVNSAKAERTLEKKNYQEAIRLSNAEINNWEKTEVEGLKKKYGSEMLATEKGKKLLQAIEDEANVKRQEESDKINRQRIVDTKKDFDRAISAEEKQYDRLGNLGLMDRAQTIKAYEKMQQKYKTYLESLKTEGRLGVETAQEVADAMGEVQRKIEGLKHELLIAPPWDLFWEQFRKRFANVKFGKLFEDSAQGFFQGVEGAISNFAKEMSEKPLDMLSSWQTFSKNMVSAVTDMINKMMMELKYLPIIRQGVSDYLSGKISMDELMQRAIGVGRQAAAEMTAQRGMVSSSALRNGLWSPDLVTSAMFAPRGTAAAGTTQNIVFNLSRGAGETDKDFADRVVRTIAQYNREMALKGR